MSVPAQSDAGQRRRPGRGTVGFMVLCKTRVATPDAVSIYAIHVLSMNEAGQIAIKVLHFVCRFSYRKVSFLPRFIAGALPSFYIDIPTPGCYIYYSL